MYRIAFFVSMAFSGIGPMVAFAMLHSRKEMFDFVGTSYDYLFKIWTTHSAFSPAPVFPSLLSYIIGLFFYAAHFPERILPDSIRDRLDSIGGGMFLSPPHLFSTPDKFILRISCNLALFHRTRCEPTQICDSIDESRGPVSFMT